MRPFYSVFSLLVFLLISAGLNSPTALAQSPWRDAPTYRDKVLQKFDFGVRNFLVGWTEIISETSGNYKQKGNKINSFIAGLGKGIVLGVWDTAGGFLHAASAPVPALDLPLPQNGVDVKEITGGELVTGPRAEMTSEPAVAERQETQDPPAAS